MDFHSRKANIVINGIMFIIVLFVFVMISYFGYKIFADLSTGIHADLTHNESIAVYDEVETRYPNVFSGLIVLLVIGFWGFVIVAALLSDTHPVMFMFAMILLFFVIITSMMLGNFYEEFFTDAEYGTLTSSFPLPHFIMSHMLELSVAIAVTSLLIAFGKNRFDE